MYSNQDKYFNFTCHAWPDSPHIIDGSAYDIDLSNQSKLMADNTGIVPKEKYRYKMIEDEYYSRTIIYTNSVSNYSDNKYHDCIVGENHYRAAFSVLCKY